MHQTTITTSLGLAALLLASCKGGEDARHYCQPIGGGGAQATEVCNTNCDQQNIQASVDANFDTAATIGVSVQAEGVLRGTAQDGVVFPQGKFAGVYLHKPPLVNGGTFDLTINTYLDGVPVDSQPAFSESGATSGALFCNFRCRADGPNLFIGIPASGAFDAIEIVYNQSAGTQSRQISTYEFCTQD